MSNFLHTELQNGTPISISLDKIENIYPDPQDAGFDAKGSTVVMVSQHRTSDQQRCFEIVIPYKALRKFLSGYKGSDITRADT